MLQYGGYTILVDSTHCTTQYDFLVVSLVTLDDFQEAVPVACAITNREDLPALKVFMNVLRNSCNRDLPVNIFMSDMVGNFYNACCTAFSTPPPPPKKKKIIAHGMSPNAGEIKRGH